MSIRLNKAIKELNIGLQTAVEFLAKRPELGEVKPEPTCKISEEQYEALSNAFAKDKEVRTQAEKLFQKKPKDQKEKKEQKEEKSAEKKEKSAPRETVRQEYKPLGKIDLDAINGKKAEPKKAEKPVEEKKPEPTPAPVVEKKVEQPKPTPAPVAEKKVEQPTPAPAPVVEKKEEPKPAAPAVEPAKPAPVAEEPKTSAPQVEVFTTHSERKLVGQRMNVVGKIDLDALNQSTRPKKKTKEERRKEREEKAQQNRGGQQGGNGEKKKRNRINKERVDINAAANQPQGNGKGKNAKNAANNQNQQGGKGKNKNKNRNQNKPQEVSEEDVARQVKETLARLTSKPSKKAAKWRKEKRDAVSEREREAAEMEAAEGKILKLTEFVTANDLAVMMDVPINKVIGTCMSIGVMVSINQRLDAETINIVAEEFGFQTEFVSSEVVNAITTEEDKEEDLEPRPPVVTVMGHVDHGKTSLLDYIRNANVIAGEAGGITQHIGAYNVKLANGRRITFLDTPGHEAFTAMRARGAKVTDIVIVIVAADDNIMPQTVEAINHASAAGVPIVFAINKIDKPTANPEKIKEGLANMNYLVEDWGGKYQSQDSSAKKGIGVDELMEKVLLEADMLELKANPNRQATGSIIESTLDKGRGYVATVLVQNGTLKMGDIILAGTHYGKIKAMFNERNQRIQKVGPAEPVLILGLNGAPTAGDTFNVMDSEQEAREIANKREQLQRELGLRTQKRVTLEDIGRRKALGSFNELNIIVKGDVDGSIEALSDSLIKLSTPEVQVNVLHKAVGAISESDVVLASASDAYIVGFQVRPSQAARRLAEKEGVDIRLYSVIYKAIEEVKSAMEGMLAPELKEEILGSAEVMQTYHISKVGTIAGAIVREGKVKRNCKVRVIRDGIVRYTGDLGSLKRFKDDVKEVTTGYECGLSVAGYNDIQEGDFIESFEEVEVKKSL